jgi:predicted MFS family arabinose efflux permease
MWGLMGAAQAGIFPCSTKAIGGLFPTTGRAFASGMLGCCMAVGWTISPRVTAELLQSLRWEEVFALYALPGLVWVLAFALLVPRYPEPAAARHDEPADWRKLVTDGPMILLCLQQFLRAAAVAFFFTWLTRFLMETRGLSEVEAGKLAFWPGVGGILGGLCGGTLSDWLLRRTGNPRLARQGLAVAAMVVGAAVALAACYTPDVRATVALLSAGAFCGYVGGVGGYTVAITYGGKRVATVFGTMNMCGNIGAGLFPFVVGWLVRETGNWNLALLLVAGLLAADAVCWAVLNPKGTLFGEVQTPAS